MPVAAAVGGSLAPRAYLPWQAAPRRHSCRLRHDTTSHGSRAPPCYRGSRLEAMSGHGEPGGAEKNCGSFGDDLDHSRPLRRGPQASRGAMQRGRSAPPSTAAVSAAGRDELPSVRPRTFRPPGTDLSFNSETSIMSIELEALRVPTQAHGPIAGVAATYDAVVVSSDVPKGGAAPSLSKGGRAESYLQVFECVRGTDSNGRGAPTPCPPKQGFCRLGEDSSDAR